jgi:hypothetical protein
VYAEGSNFQIDVELRLKWLKDKLRLERDKLTPHPRSVEEAVSALV